MVMKTGYITKVDLHFPAGRHDKFKEIPPAPETLTPDIDWLTPYQQVMGGNTGIIDNELAIAKTIWSHI